MEREAFIFRSLNGIHRDTLLWIPKVMESPANAIQKRIGRWCDSDELFNAKKNQKHRSTISEEEEEQQQEEKTSKQKGQRWKMAGQQDQF